MNSQANFADMDTIQAEIIRLRDTKSLTWREIALETLFRDIPIGTLHRIYKTGRVPRRYWRRFGIRAVPVTSRIAISKTNMASAARSILLNIDRANAVALAGLILERTNENQL